jgi:hypothetical protein
MSASLNLLHLSKHKGKLTTTNYKHLYNAERHMLKPKNLMNDKQEDDFSRYTTPIVMMRVNYEHDMRIKSQCE